MPSSSMKPPSPRPGAVPRVAFGPVQCYSGGSAVQELMNGCKGVGPRIMARVFDFKDC